MLDETSSRTRRQISRTLAIVASGLAVCCLLVARSARATPEAHILRIDPRTGLKDGKPVFTTVVEVVEVKRLSDALQPCARLSGTGLLSCWSEQLEKPGALWQSFPFPEQNAHFLVKVSGEDHLTRFADKTQWGKAQGQANVGTAWLVAVDAASGMGEKFGDARAIAHEIVEEMQPNDLMDLMFFDDVEVVRDTKWKTFKQRAELGNALNEQRSTSVSHGHDRALFSEIKSMTQDAFGSLNNTDPPDQIPLHQAMVLLSNGAGRGDPESASPSAEVFHQYLDRGRFPEDNTALPKTPLPVVSIWLPNEAGLVESIYRNNEAQFMQSLANPEIGGFFDIVQRGAGAAKAKAILGLIRARFNAMWVVHWTASCINPSVDQSFKLVFENTHPPIAPDGTFKDVPVGMDPSQWPLDVDFPKTVKAAQDNPLYPGGQFNVYGDFCWGGDRERAEAYFIPAGTKPAPGPTSSRDPEVAKKALQQLQAAHVLGTALASGDTYVTLSVPDDENVLDGAGDNMVARVVVYDKQAHRASAVDEKGALTLKATKKPLPLTLIAGVAGLGVVIVLLVVVVLRSGGAGRGRAGTFTTPPAPSGYAFPPGGYAPSGPYGLPGMAADPMAATTAAESMMGAAGGPAPLPMGSPGNAYGMRAHGPGSATLWGSAGQFVVRGSAEVRVGRDPAQCPILLNEPRVSGVHATLKLEGGQLLVRDENSNNGTWLYGARLTPGVWTLLPTGTPVRFGPVELTVQLDA